MNTILKSLCKPLDSEVRQLVFRSAENMMRSINFLHEKSDPNMKEAFSRGWDFSKLEALVCVITFYQIVIGPIKSSSSLHGSFPWGKRDILYGKKLRVDQKTTRNNSNLVNAFEEIAGNLGIDFWWLQTTNAEDLVYNLTHEKEEYEFDPF